MIGPRRKKRLKLNTILSRFLDEYGVLLLAKIWPIYEKIANNEMLNGAEEDVAQKVDDYYVAYDSENTPDTFDACGCGELDSEAKGTAQDALEAAVQTYLG